MAGRVMRGPEGRSGKELTSSDIERYRLEWRAVQARFRRHPGVAVAQADDLVRRLVGGYPYSSADRPPWIDTLKMGALLGGERRRELKRVLAHYAGIIEEILEAGSSDEIVLDRPRRRIDLRVPTVHSPRPAIRGGKHA